ncbi:hypothetical protein [Methylophilus sp. 3sh_L]|uniref:hypothetical protein n=1 Tax=Methylophilus sp. 3sh_L TaxID=3377114 RepID=UPI00398E59B0
MSLLLKSVLAMLVLVCCLLPHKQVHPLKAMPDQQPVCLANQPRNNGCLVPQESGPVAVLVRGQLLFLPPSKHE